MKDGNSGRELRGCRNVLVWCEARCIADTFSDIGRYRDTGERRNKQKLIVIDLTESPRNLNPYFPFLGDQGKHDLDNRKGRKWGTGENSEEVILHKGTKEGRERRE